MPKQTAVSEQAPEGTNLEQVIAAALAATDTTGAVLYELIGRTESGIAMCQQLAIDTETKAFDPMLMPNPKEARAAMEDARFSAARLRTLLPRLQLAAEKKRVEEEHSRWRDRAEALSVRVEAASERFSEFPELVSRIIDLVKENEALTLEISQLHGSAPSGEPRRLRTPEQIARGVPMDTPSIATDLKLPDFDGRVIFPPPVKIDESLYAPIVRPEWGPDWWRYVEAERQERQAREDGEAAEAERDRKEFYGQRAAE